MKYGVVSFDKTVAQGRPVFTGTEVPVQTFFEYLEGGRSFSKFLEDFPDVNQRDIIEVLQMSKVLMTNEKVVGEYFPAS